MEEFSPMDMLVKLYDLPDSRETLSRIAAAGISIRRALPPEKHKVLDWVRGTFSQAWASEADVAFARQPVSCFVAVQAKRLLGFACHDAACPNFFGPTGVDANSRGKGIGAALLLACLEDMRRQGFGYAIIGGVGPADFYSKTVGAIPIEGSERGVYRGLL
jgi:GNAT superfamily N-acetyltransferase